MKRKLYSYEVARQIEAAIPPSILKALKLEGWNVFGIYQTVVDKLAEEKKALKKAAKLAKESDPDWMDFS